VTVLYFTIIFVAAWSLGEWAIGFWRG
jgi:hypothetical protein